MAECLTCFPSGLLQLLVLLVLGVSRYVVCVWVQSSVGGGGIYTTGACVEDSLDKHDCFLFILITTVMLI
jgi:hypothetical protein